MLWNMKTCPYKGNCKNELVTTIFLVGLLLFNFLKVYGQSTDFNVMVLADGKIHNLNVKASQGANNQIIPVSGYKIDPEDVVMLYEGLELSRNDIN
jgi:hypothetical protein